MCASGAFNPGALNLELNDLHPFVFEDFTFFYYLEISVDITEFSR